MATAAEVTRRIDTDLRVLDAEIDFLPEMAAGWAEEPDVNRDVYYLEWRNLMAVLETLDRHYRSGVMAPEQQECYRALIRELEHALPIFEQLGLPQPPVPLDT